MAISQITQGSLANTISIATNRVINGSMAIDQRNGGSAQTITAAAALAYTADRWYAYCTGANVTGQRVAGIGTNQYMYRFSGASSVTAVGFGQRIEQLNSFDMANTTVTLSADLQNSLLTTVTWTAYYANTADTFGSLASPTRTQIANGTFIVSNTPARYSASINIPATANTGLEIVLSVGAQTSGYWNIGAVQLESGGIATPIEKRLYGNELVLCQRYYQTVNVNAYAVNSNFGAFNPDYYYPVSLPVAARTTPTITRTNVTDSSVTSGIVSAAVSGFSVIMELTASAGQSTFTAVASAEL